MRKGVLALGAAGRHTVDALRGGVRGVKEGPTKSGAIGRRRGGRGDRAGASGRLRPANGAESELWSGPLCTFLVLASCSHRSAQHRGPRAPSGCHPEWLGLEPGKSLRASTQEKQFGAARSCKDRGEVARVAEGKRAAS